MEITPSVETSPFLEDTAGEPSRLLRWFAGLMFCGACVAAIMLARYKLQALLYHFVDFPYFIECTHKLLEPGARLRINPDGLNCLGFFGRSGVSSVHQSIHLEPVKYGWALMGYLLKEPEFLFTFFAVMYFCPILYFSAHFRCRTWLDTAFGMLFILMYCTFPAVANAVTFDLRPYALLTPACVLAVLSIRLERPIGEQLLFFNLMFFFREEAILLGVAVILYAAMRSNGPFASRAKAVLPMIFSWCAWAAIMAAYFRWTQYPNRFTPAGAREFLAGHPHAMLLTALALLCAGAALYLVWRFRHEIMFYRSSLILLLLLVPTAGMFLNMSQSEALRRTGGMNLIYGARWAFIYVTALLILLELWGEPWRPEVRRRWLGSAAAISILLLSLNFAGGQGITALINQCANRVDPARLVWNARDQIPRGAEVMTDRDTLQAFGDYPNVTVFEREPVWAATETDHFDRGSRPALSRLRNEKTNYLILSRKNSDHLQDILGPSAHESLTVLGENERYELLQLNGQSQAEMPTAQSAPASSRAPAGAVSG